MPYLVSPNHLLLKRSRFSHRVQPDGVCGRKLASRGDGSGQVLGGDTGRESRYEEHRTIPMRISNVCANIRTRIANIRICTRLQTDGVYIVEDWPRGEQPEAKYWKNNAVLVLADSSVVSTLPPHTEGYKGFDCAKSSSVRVQICTRRVRKLIAARSDTLLGMTRADTLIHCCACSEPHRCLTFKELANFVSAKEGSFPSQS